MMSSAVIVVLSVFLVAVHAQDCTLPKVQICDCCPGFMPNSMSPAVMAECGLPPDATPLTPIPCDVTTCILKKINLLTPDGKPVDKATFISTLEPQYSSPEFKALLGPSYDSCTSMDTKNPCPPFAFIMCMKGYMSKNCPASVAVNSADCTASRAFFENCILKKL